MKTLTLKVSKGKESFCGLNYQEINQEVNGIRIEFFVSDLDCLADATVNRALFDVYDYVEALNKGIQLAQMGYTLVMTEDVLDKESEQL